MIRRKHPVVTVPVLPRRRHEIGKPIEELKRRELDDAAGPRPCGLPRATWADPVGGFVPGQHVTDAGDATARVPSDKEPLEREGRSNGQPSGAQVSTTTEDGAYNVNGAITGRATTSGPCRNCWGTTT